MKRLATIACIVLLAKDAALAASSVDRAIEMLVGALETGAPLDEQQPQNSIIGIAVWQWLDEKLPEPIRRAFRDDLEVALIQSKRFVYFNRERLRRILREHRVNLSDLADPATMRKFAAAGIHGFLSVEVLDASCAHPEFDDLDTHCVLLAKLTDSRTATIAWAGFIEGSNPDGLRQVLKGIKPAVGTTKYRRLAQAIAASLQKANPLAPPQPQAPAQQQPQRPMVITLSNPSEDGTAGIGITNPDKADFDLKTFKDELLVAIANTNNHAYVDPEHIDRLIAEWTRDGEGALKQGKAALAKTFALDGYLFGTIRAAQPKAMTISMRLVSLLDGSEAWAAKVNGKDLYPVLEPRPLPEPPIPRPIPPKPEPLTFEDIERPLKNPKERPAPLPLPEVPDPPKWWNPLTSALYLPLGLPRDALDALFQVADRVPLLGAATSGLYRYGGGLPVCRAGTRQRFLDDITTGRALTYGQLATRDEYPTFFPLLASARRNPGGTSNYILQMSLGTLEVFDLLDAFYSVLDRTPVLGTAATPLLLPLNYAWRLVPDGRSTYCAQVNPARAECRLTFGSLASDEPWSLFPNARSWPFTFTPASAARRAYAHYQRRYDEVKAENQRRLKDWLAQEEARKRYNEEARRILDDRNAQLLRKYQQNVERIKRENQLAQQRYEAQKAQAEEHNRRAAMVNTICRHVLDLPAALNPKPVPRYVPKAPLPPRPAPKQPAPKQPAPKRPAPKQPAPKQPAPKQPAPKQPAPKQPAPKQPAPKQPAPKQPAPKQPAPKQPAPKQPAPKQPAPKQPAPKQPAPKQPAPKQPAPKQPAPKQPAPKQPAPKQPAPKQPAPKQPAPKQPAPKQPAPPAAKEPAQPAPKAPAKPPAPQPPAAK